MTKNQDNVNTMTENFLNYNLEKLAKLQTHPVTRIVHQNLVIIFQAL